MYHILYNPGAGGDMVAAVIDSKDYILGDIDINVRRGSLRSELKFKLIKEDPEHAGLYHYAGKHVLIDGSDKSEYMKKIEATYLAVTLSHDFNPELREIFDTILIDDSEYKYARWCMDRCHRILPATHPPVTEEELKLRIERVQMTKDSNKVKVIDFKDVIEGRLIEKLQQWVKTPLNTEVYNHWLTNIVSRLPKID